MLTEEKKPNLFVIGAAKSGTTSLCYYLDQHPRINVSNPKEPNFFATELTDEYRKTLNWNDYLKSFDWGNLEVEYFCDGSPTNLPSPYAVKNILDINPSSKFIVILRNPIDRVYSAHAQRLLNGDENEKDFFKAWNLQEKRKQGKNIPARCIEPLTLQYKDRGSIGKHLENVLKLVERDNLLILFFDDLKADAEGTYMQIMKFLDLEMPPDLDFTIKKKRVAVKNVFLHRLNKRRPKTLQLFSNSIKRILGVKAFGIAELIDKNNISSPSDTKMPSDIRRFLEDEFDEDIRIIERITGRDLSSWRRQE